MSDAADTASAPVLEIGGARATIRLNRPKHLNRLQAEDLDALLKLFDRIEADPAIRVMVLTGTGRAFSAGYDLNSVADRATSANEQQSAGSAFEVVVNRLEDLGVPTICRLNGGVYGGSTDLALACDFRIGVDTRRDVHAGGAARPALLQERHRALCVAARRRQRQETVPDRAEDQRAGNAADRLSHRDGAGGIAGRGSRQARRPFSPATRRSRCAA